MRRDSPSLGLFWFVAASPNGCSFANLARSFVQVPEIAGFKTLDEGHVDIWPLIQRREAALRPFEYDDFPRGRVNWRASDDRWLLLLDPALRAGPFVSYVAESWQLPAGNRLLVSTDLHYRSRVRVSPPVLSEMIP